MRSVDQQSLESGAASPGIKLKVSEPLSSNPFVAVPLDQQKAAATAPPSAALRQKRLRVPRGGSAERFSSAKARSSQAALASKSASQLNHAPSLRIVLEPDPQSEEVALSEDERQQQKEAESLARFAANFPKIPNGLIFRFPDAEEEKEPPSEAMGLSREDSFDLDEEDAFPRGSVRAGGPGPQGYDRIASRREPTYANPRYEKMIRDAKARTQQPVAPSASRPTPLVGAASKTARIPAVSGPLNGGLRTSADLPPRSTSTKAAFVGAASPAASQPMSAPPASGYPFRTQPAPVTLGWKGQASKGSAPNSNPQPSVPSGSLRVQAQVAPLGAKGARMSPSAQQSAPSGPLGTNSGPLPPSRTPLQPRVAPTAPTQTAPVTSSPLERPSDAMSSGKPLLDSQAIEESTIFDEPPIPISEGMKDAEKDHNKGRKLLIGSLVLVIVALVGVLAFIGTTGTIPVPEFHITTVDNISKGDQGGSSGASSDGGSASDDVGDQAPDNGAGAVTYRYTAKTASGVEYSVEEKTIFDDAGNCTFTTMAMQFPTEAAAKDFTDSLARDLGAKYTLDSLDGANATVTVDNSGLGLDRQSYENALRYSVDDLVILKK